MTRQMVSQYEIVQKLGEGGMGVVYRARDTRLGRFVALKLLPSHLVASAEARARLLEEARAISALNHPHIATLYEVGEHEGTLFLALEYLPGGTLRSRIRDLRAAGLRLPVADAIRYGAQAAQGLAHAHRRGIIHRDVKSENVMLTEEGAVKITDFGLARHRGGSGLTRDGSVPGTASYVAPERVQGQEADHRSDVFSLGVVLYEMATGELPFQGEHEAAVLHALLHTPTPAPRLLRAELPEEYERIVLRATAKDPEERHQSMEELASGLQCLEEGRPAVASTPRRDSAQDATVALPAVTVPPNLAATGRRRIRAALGAMVLVLVAAGLWLGGGVERIAGWHAIPAERTLAVLPFVNVGGAPANQAFCDGLMETLSTKLTQLEQYQGALRVVPTTEVHKQGITSPREARRVFGVALALTGSVERSQEQLRLNLNLVDAKSLRQLRADTIDTRISDVAVLQDRVVSRAAAILKLELRPDARKMLTAGGTQVAAAYDLYLQGVGCLARWDKTENVESAISLFQRAIQQDASFALAHAGLGEAFWRKWQLTREAQWVEEARQHCTRAVELNGRLADVYVTQGAINTGTGHYEDAVQDFERALQLNPVSAAAHLGRAQAYERLGRAQDAELAFRKAIQLRPNDWAGHQYLGMFYIRRAEYAKAEPCLRRVTELTPDNYWGFRTLGGIYHYLERYEQAIAMQERSIRLRPTALAYSNLGTTQFFQGRYQEAAEAFEKAVEMGTANRTVWGNLADAYLRVPGQAEKAPDLYRQAIQLAERDLAVNPKDAEARAHLAVFSARLNQKQRALAETTKARGLAPGNMDVLFLCALAYELVGRRAPALETLKGALQGGYSRAEVQRHPDLAALRRDPRFTALIRSSGAAAPGQAAR